MFTVPLFCALLSVALLVSASPTARKDDDYCDASQAAMDLPANQTVLVAPSTPPIFVMLGVGIQNYTCSSATSTYISIGAVASLLDLSCLDQQFEFATIQAKAFNIWTEASEATTATSIGRRVGAQDLLGFHYFVVSPSGTGISPIWDFTAIVNDPSAFVIGARVGGIPAPTGTAKDIDWLSLNGVQGNLAKAVFRIDTVGGQPPTSCVPGSDPISVKYTSKYYLF
ncbi:hypothetical protein C8R43DRAFT_484674 [Mycena crocata]|nr:hypothetical protein C8R43DRAFT_484674 [Mycena crocata]